MGDGFFGGAPFRNFFVFDIPPFIGTVTAAVLTVYTYDVASVNGSETYQLHEVTTPVPVLTAGGTGQTATYTDLGDGPVYGSRTISTSENYRYVNIPLGAAFFTALTAASGRSLALGGQVTSLDGTAFNSEYLFNSSWGLGGTVSLTFTLQEGTVPSIVQNPQSRAVPAGGSVTLSPGVCGQSPFSYQWQVNGTNLPGATGFSLSLNNVTEANEGDYRIIVTNAFGAVTSAVATLTVDYCILMPSGLAAWWRGEFNGYDHAGTNHALLGNGVWFTSGRVGSAFNFDGVNDWAYAYHNPQLDFGAADSLTVAFWFRNGLSSRRMTLVDKTDANSPYAGYYFDVNATAANQLYFALDSGAPGLFLAVTDSRVSDSQWHLVVGVLDRASQTASLYLDGALVATGSAASIGSLQNNFGLLLGSDYSVTLPFRGQLDEVQLFRRALASNEVVALYDAGVAGVCVPPAIYVQPASRSVPAGATTTIFITVDAGFPYRIQWQFNGTDIPGANGFSLTLTSVTEAQQGDYRVIITNDYGAVTSAVATLTVDYCAPQPANLVSWWRAENNANDFIGPNHGFFQNGATTTGSGKVGSAFFLDGVNDYIQVGPQPGLTMSTGLTVSAWIYPTGPGSPGELGMIVNKEGEYELGRFNDGTIRWAIADANNAWAWENTGFIANLNEWTHVALTYNSGTVRLFANGGLVHQLGIAGTTMGDVVPAQNDFRIGSRQSGGTDFFAGRIDEVQIFNRALTSNEVASIYNAGTAGLCFPPVISGQPQSATNFAGATQNFSPGSVAPAPGSGPLTFQWFFNGAPIAGATNVILTLSNLTTNEAGNYFLVVTNLGGATTSSVATLTVRTEPYIAFVGAGVYPVGAEIPIYGYNFSPEPTNNAVWFGAVRAQVVSATNNQLVVIVPAGASYAPVSVTVNGLTAYERRPFSPVFESNLAIDASTFAPKFDLPTGDKPYYPAAGDIDGDGRIDLVVGNLIDNTVSVFRNQSTAGTLNAAAFPLATNIPTDLGPNGCALADVDGDGWLDLLVTAHHANKLAVFRNTGAPTSVAFADAVYLDTGTEPVGIATGDFDGDGRTDVAVANSAIGMNTVSIYRFIGSAGVINAASFAPRMDVVMGNRLPDVVTVDLTGDGRLDLAASALQDNTLTVRANTSVPGALSYSDVGSYGIGSSSAFLTAADFDGDGRLDLAVTSFAAANVGVFRNVSASGALTLAAMVTFPVGSPQYECAAGDLNGDGKPELLTANVDAGTVSVFRNKSTIGVIDGSSFAPRQDFVSGAGCSGVLVADLDGDGRPDLVSVNRDARTVSIRRNVIPPPPPVIASLSATSGAVGSTLTITGTRYDPEPTNNIVYFGAVRAQVVSATSTQLVVIVPAGASYAPVSVTVNGLTAYDRRPFSPAFESNLAIDSSSFGPRIDLPNVAEPYWVAVGDLDGDGQPDLVIANGQTNTVSVHRNVASAGALGTESFAPPQEFTVGSRPNVVVLADVDGDGRLDLVTANNAADSLSVRRNTSSPGALSFEARVDLSTGSRPYQIAATDLDRDGRTDLAVANNGANTITVYRFIGSAGAIDAGSFAGPVTLSASGTQLHGIVAVDLDLGGPPDVAVTAYSGDVVTLFQNNSLPGVLQFSASDAFGTLAQPNTLAAGDLDGDGRLDLAFGQAGAGKLAYARNASVSFPYFPSRTDVTVGNAPFGTAVGDLNGDGKPELAIGNYGSGTVSLFANIARPGILDGSSFGPRVDLVSGTGPQSMAMADLDGDARPEVIAVNTGSRTVSVWRNVIPPPPPTIASLSATSGAVGSTLTITGTRFDPEPTNNIVYFGAVRAQVVSATSTQLVVTVPAGASYAPIAVTAGGFTAYSAQPFDVTFPSNLAIDATSFAPRVSFAVGHTAHYITAADLDGDGRPEAIVLAAGSAKKVSIYRNTSTPGSLNASSFAPRLELSTGAGINPYEPVIGDLDGDGKPDIAVPIEDNRVGLFRNLSTAGNLAFETMVEIPAGAAPDGVAIRDVDGDGKADLVVANASAASISVFRNIGSPGSLTAGSFAARVDFATGANPQSVVLADVDGDGKPDAATANYAGTSASVLRNTSVPGVVSFAAVVNLGTGARPTETELIDVDGDGKPDVVLANRDGLAVSVFRNISTAGSLSAASFEALINFSTGALPLEVAAGDLNGDGKPDLVTPNFAGNSLSVFRNLATAGSITSGSLAPRLDLPTGNEANSAVIADFDLDGRPDIAVADFDVDTFSVLRNVIKFNPTITWPAPADILDGTPLGTNQLNATANVSGTFVYSPPSGTVLSYGTYTLTAVFTPDDTTNYNTVTNTVQLTVLPVPPEITSQPQDQSLPTGATANFSVAVTGSVPRGYQWFFNNMTLAGATNDTLSLPGLQYAQDGNYFVVVTNIAGSVTSRVARLIVLDITPPALVCPNNTFVEAAMPDGVQFFFVAVVTDDHDPTPTWTAAPPSGSIFPLGPTLVMVTARDASSNVTTCNFTVTVVDSTPPVLTLPPDQTVFTTDPTGAVVTYPPATATDAVSAPIITYSQASGTRFAIGTNVVVVTARDAAGNERTGTFKVIVLAPPLITMHPLSQTVVKGSNVTFSVTVAGTAPLSYQWRSNGVDLAGETGPTLTLLNAQGAYAGLYSVIVSNALGTALSSNAVLAVIVEPVITAPPGSVTVSPGAAVTLSVTASSLTPVSYQWQLNGTNLPGATNMSYTIPAAGDGDAGVYVVLITNEAGTTPSNPVSLSLVSVDIYPGLTISGSVGQVYRIDYTTSLDEPIAWQVLTNLALPSSPYLFTDPTPARTPPRRYYRAVPQ